MATSHSPKLRVMVDANVLIAGTIWARFPYEVLQHAVNGDYQLVLTQYIIEEARRGVLKIIRELLPELENILDQSLFEEFPTPSDETILENNALVRDVKDVGIALAAIEAKVDFLVTQDRDFTDHTPENEHLHEQLNIILPAAFLRYHMGWESDNLEKIRKRNWSDFS